jgi:hypothetical protein
MFILRRHYIYSFYTIIKLNFNFNNHH